jgi:hypothetical protein
MTTAGGGQQQPLSPEDLFTLLTSEEPLELRGYLAQLTEGVPYLRGTAARALALDSYGSRSSGLLVPSAAVGPSPSDYIGTYLTLREYAPTPDLLTGAEMPPIEILTEVFASRVEQRQLVTDLAAFLHMFNDAPHYLRELQAAFGARLSSGVRSRYEIAMNQAAGAMMGRLLVSRQAVLQALRTALIRPEPNGESAAPANESWVRALLLTHAISDGLYSSTGEAAAGMLAGYPARLFMEMVQNATFHEAEDALARFDRHIRLWTQYGPLVQRVTLRLQPEALLVDATGLEAIDFMALGFAVWALRNSWTPDGTLWQRDDFNSDMPQESIDAFLSLVSSSPAEFRAVLNETDSAWDFLEFQRTPVLRIDDQLLLLDSGLLLDLITAGLYWYVHDHERDAFGESARQVWTQAYGEMFELMALDSIQAMALPIIGSSERTFIGEDELRASYMTSACEAAVSFGGEIVLFEVVSGRLTVPTRVEGVVDAFERDTEKIVLKKARQLDAIGRAILANERPITGVVETPGLELFPVVVAAEGYPVEPMSAAYIQGKLLEEDLLTDARFEPLAIIDFGELEMLEGLSERGHLVPDIIRAWKTSPLAQMPLRNHLLAVFEHDVAMRPSRMTGQMDRTFDDVLERLQLRA